MKFKVGDIVRLTREALLKFYRWGYAISPQEKEGIKIRKVLKRSVFCSNGRTYSKSFLENISLKKLKRKEISEKFGVSEDFTLVDE